jgi:hypothetical protein
MKERIYLETTIVSYLAARPSRDLVLAAHQQQTRQWWDERSGAFDLFISQIVLREAERGNPDAASQRLRLLDGLAMLPLTDEVDELAQALLTAGMLPEVAKVDCAHVAVATIHEMDVLLTWNCRHLANGLILRRLGRFLRGRGYEAPAICTPDELMGEE